MTYTRTEELQITIMKISETNMKNLLVVSKKSKLKLRTSFLGVGKYVIIFENDAPFGDIKT